MDAFNHNYRTVVVEDCCGDRSQASHAINLCDMNAKYADVVASDEVIAYIEGLPSGLFELPSEKGVAPGPGSNSIGCTPMQIGG